MADKTKTTPKELTSEAQVNNIIPHNENKVNNQGENIDKNLGYDYDNLKKSITLNYSQYSGSKISTKLFIKILCSIFTIKQETIIISGNHNVKYYKLNKYKDVYQDYNIRNLGQDIMLIADAIDYKGNEIKFVIENVLYQLNISNFNNLGIKTINHSPKELIKFNNGILNIKTKEFYQKGSDQYYNILNKYDFVNAFDFNYLHEIDDNNQYLLVYNKLIKDLSNNKEDQILLFNQLVFSVIEGNGRGKYIMLSGQAGSGKTTFGNILKHIAGEDYTRYVTMDSFDDDNTINSLSMSTRLILGDDLQKSAKLVGKSLRHFKTLVDGNQLSVSVKYEPNRIIQTTGLWLQMMNDDPSIYEANDAIKDRTILVKIEGRNHRTAVDPGEKEFSKRLDKYTGKRGKADPNFIQTVVSYILNTVNYFDEFTISEEMRKATEDMVDDASWAKQFTDWLNDYGVFNFKILPATDLKDLFYQWSRENNPILLKTSAKTITKEISPYLKLKNYEYKAITKTIDSIPILEYSRNILIDEFGYNIHTIFQTKKSNIWINQTDLITKDDLIEFQNRFPEINCNNFNELTLKDKVIAKHLSLRGNTDILAWINQTESI